MTADEYQKLALRTVPSTQYDPETNVFMYPGTTMVMSALGLCGEAGEYGDDIKKYVFHYHPLDEKKAVKELGDIMWYLAVAAAVHGVKLSEVMDKNVAKLRTRYPEGFSTEASMARVDKNEPE